MHLQTKLKVADIIPQTRAEGPGLRFCIWVQGCPLACPSCCNPNFFNAKGGQWQLVSTLFKQIIQTPKIEGITLLGGEPIVQAPALAQLARQVQQQGLSVMMFSGYTLTECQQMDSPDIQQLFNVTDIFVDGRYDHNQPDNHRRWIGSKNQTMHFFSQRYQPDDPQFMAKNTLEIRLNANQIKLNGWPQAITDMLTHK